MADGDLVNIFMEEATDLLEELESVLLELENNSEDQDLINQAFRAMHTLKGSAGLTGFNYIADFVHQAENILEQCRAGQLGLNTEIINLLLISLDVLEKMLSELEGGENKLDGDTMAKVQAAFSKYLSTSQSATKDIGKESEGLQTKEKIYLLKIDYNENLFQTGTDPLLLLQELSDYSEIIETNINFSQIPDIYKIDPERCYLQQTIIIKTEQTLATIRDIFVFIELDSGLVIDDITDNYRTGIDLSLADKKFGEILIEKGILDQGIIDDALAQQNRLGEILEQEGQISSNQVEKILEKQLLSKKVQEKNTIKVDADKLESLMNTMAELVIAQANVKELALKKKGKQADEISAALEQVDKNIKNLQEGIMKSRMVPVGNSFLRLRRLVRDLSRQQGKEVELEIKGEETELDKKVIEEITDPLKHMIRNAIDHGLEKTEERLAAGKNRTGKILLDAYHQEGHVIIKVADDGRGLDQDKILNKAIEQGIIKEGRELSEEDIYQLICHPGLSTSSQVTETSGRGVGMDVVKSNIEQLRGNLSIESEQAKGTVFKIKIPLTMAIIEGMAVRVGNEYYIIPLNSILEFIQPVAEHLKTVNGKGETVRVREDYITLGRLYKIFDLQPQYTKPADGILVILQNEEKKICLLVDEIIGQQQVVVKSLENNYSFVEGIAGATIMGNGKVALIIDTGSIIKLLMK